MLFPGFPVPLMEILLTMERNAIVRARSRFDCLGIGEKIQREACDDFHTQRVESIKIVIQNWYIQVDGILRPL